MDAGYLDLVVGPAYSNPNYTLAAAAAAHTLIVGGTSSITATLANTGGTGDG